MNLALIANIVTCLCAFGGFIYGLVRVTQGRKAIYLLMIIMAVGSMAFGRLYQIIRLLTGGEIYNEFQLGVMGVIGSLIFLFSANFGVMDSLADDGKSEYRKYRLIPLIVPVIELAIYIVFFILVDCPLVLRVVAGGLFLSAMLSGYYHLKHLIFPDVDFGVIKCLEKYNFLALIYSFLCITEMVLIAGGSQVLTSVAEVLMGIILLLMVFAVERGFKKWTT